MNTVKSKYGAKKIEIDGIIFQSQLESSFYLKLKEKGITILDRQTKFVLQESFRIGKELIREIAYISDFLIEWCGEQYYIDSKGMETPDFKLKHKIWLYKYGATHKLIVTGSFNRLMETLNAIKDPANNPEKLESPSLINTRKGKKRKKKNTSDLKTKATKA